MSTTCFNNDQFEIKWANLNAHLESIRVCRGLEESLCEHIRIHHDSGFILDSLKDVICSAIVSDEETELALVAQYNKHRATREGGAGRRQLPPGRQCINANCFLCWPNVMVQQCGLEVGYEITLRDHPFIVWPNPFPFHPYHETIATRDHVPQDWRRGIGQILSEMLDLVRAAPGFVVLWNSRDAGASIPGHFHYHACHRWDNKPLPLEVAAKNMQQSAPLAIVEHYPGAIIAAHGSAETIIAELAPVVQSWLAASGDTAALNLIATCDPDDPKYQWLYFCPRDRQRGRVAGISGIVGGLEMAGELVLSTEDEKMRLDRGAIDYTVASRIISSVQAPLFRAFFLQATQE